MVALIFEEFGIMRSEFQVGYLASGLLGSDTHALTQQRYMFSASTHSCTMHALSFYNARTVLLLLS